MSIDLDRFYGACRDGVLQRVRELAPHITNRQSYYDKGLELACAAGHVPVVRFLLDQCMLEDCSGAFHEACERGHLEVVKLLVGRPLSDYDGGFYRACHAGHLEVAQYLVETRPDELVSEDYDEAIEGACERGHLSVVCYLFNLHRGLRSAAPLKYACENDRLPVVQFLLENMVYTEPEYNWAFQAACKNGHLAVVNYMIDISSDRREEGNISSDRREEGNISSDRREEGDISSDRRGDTENKVPPLGYDYDYALYTVIMNGKRREVARLLVVRGEACLDIWSREPEALMFVSDDDIDYFLEERLSHFGSGCAARADGRREWGRMGAGLLDGHLIPDLVG